MIRRLLRRWRRPVDDAGFCVNPSWSLHQDGEVTCSRCGDGEGGWRKRA
jgi:hypothetical protein